MIWFRTFGLIAKESPLSGPSAIAWKHKVKSSKGTSDHKNNCGFQWFQIIVFPRLGKPSDSFRVLQTADSEERPQGLAQVLRPWGLAPSGLCTRLSAHIPNPSTPASPLHLSPKHESSFLIVNRLAGLHTFDPFPAPRKLRPLYLQLHNWPARLPCTQRTL